MKIIIRVLLLIAVFALLFVSYRSVVGQIEFDREAEARNREVIQRLVDIRTAQIALRTRTGSFTADLDSLAYFVQHGNVVSIRSEGELSEAQLEAGMTVARAISILNAGDRREIDRHGLWDTANNRPLLIRDSIFTPVMEEHFANRPNFNPADLPYVPHGNGARFEMGVGFIGTASGPLQVFEARTPFTTYMSDLDERMVQQLIQERLDRPGDDNAPRRFPGMQVGSLTTVVNNAGNWE